MGTDFPMLLGGSAQPLGCAVSFLDVVLRAVQGVHGSCEVTRVESLHDALIALDPMEAPWTRELLADCEGWTAYVNNGMSGGDSSAIAPALARHLDCRCVVAVNVQSYGPGHAATQLEILGPEGEPPLQYVRALSAHAEDGRWGWYESGEVQPFEDGDRYQRRRVRERLDRSLLVEYLDHLGIHVDDPEFFLTAVVIQQRVDYEPRRESAAEFRAENGWN